MAASIVRAELKEISGKLPRPVANSRSEWSERHGLLLRLTDSEGHTAVGEASPLPGYSLDAVHEVQAAFNRLSWDGLPPFYAGAALTDYFDEALSFVPSSLPSGRFALETSLIGIIAQQLDLDSGQILKKLALEVNGECAHTARAHSNARLLFSQDSKALIREAIEALESGVDCLKIKIGRPQAFQDELRSLEILRKEIGKDVLLRLDANQGWALGVAENCLDALKQIAPEFVEEPVRFEDLLRLSEPRLPIALDESLHGEEGDVRLERVLDAGRCQVVVLKPMCLGGALACFRRAAKARGHGADIVVSHLLDGPIALAAAEDLALALGPQRPMGLGPHPMLDILGNDPSTFETIWTKGKPKP